MAADDSLHTSSPFYRDINGESEVLQTVLRAKLPVLLMGPTGCGKSRFVENMAHKLDRPLITVSCNEDTSASDLIGRFIIRGGDTVWQDGPATRAVRSGCFLYLDEVSEAREDVIVVLHSLADYRRTLYIDRTNEIVNAPDSFALIASFNPGYQSVLKEMKPSTRHRFTAIRFDYPSPAIESEIVAAEAKCSLEWAKKLVTFASRVRSNKELILRETVSTRLLVHAGKLIHLGLAPRIAANSAIAQVLTDEKEQLAALQDLVSLCL